MQYRRADVAGGTYLFTVDLVGRITQGVFYTGYWRFMMSLVERLQHVEFLVDASGNKKGVVVDYAIWEELLTELEGWDDAKEIQHLREIGEETVPWEQAKAEFRSEGVDV